MQKMEARRGERHDSLQIITKSKRKIIVKKGKSSKAECFIPSITPLTMDMRVQKIFAK
ncbi:MAG: hypothetical protein ACI9P5_000805 [Saprospiraceae bacterium]|jgi:hypothetical protein